MWIPPFNVHVIRYIIHCHNISDIISQSHHSTCRSSYSTSEVAQWPEKRQWTILNDADFATYLHMLLYIYVFFVYCDEGDRCESERFNKFGSLDTYSLFAPKCLFVAKYSSCFLHIIHICYLLWYPQIHRLDTLDYNLTPVGLVANFKALWLRVLWLYGIF